MPVTPTRQRLRLATLAEIVLGVALVVALVAGAPTWEVVVLAVLFADAALYGAWLLVRARRATSTA
ncbi:hypothetical protein [Paraconexibacter sp.]|uniref:hypothetical protein n=1 Tax=Paraconexibacter sp. TaxID=2949640 RepID=UPI0035648E68